MKKILFILVLLPYILTAQVSKIGGQKSIETVITSPIAEDGGVEVDVLERFEETIGLYLYRTDAIPVLDSTININDTIIYVTSSTGVEVGDAVTIYEDYYVFQTLARTITDTSIVIYTPSSKIFTTNALVHCGPWNMAVDGSSADSIFNIYAPASNSISVHEITISGLSDTEMDWTTFLGIADGVGRGFLIRHEDGSYKNLGLFVNNLGMEEFGFQTTFPPINKKTQYGIIARKNLKESTGALLRINGEAGDRIAAIIRDDLSSESLLAVIILGHLVTE